MSKHNKTSGTNQPKNRELLVKTLWFMRPHIANIEVWEGDKLIIDWLAPIEVAKDRQLVLEMITSLTGGGEAKWVD
jgi:hypothetical protein